MGAYSPPLVIHDYHAKHLAISVYTEPDGPIGLEMGVHLRVALT